MKHLNFEPWTGDLYKEKGLQDGKIAWTLFFYNYRAYR